MNTNTNNVLFSNAAKVLKQEQSIIQAGLGAYFDAISTHDGTLLVTDALRLIEITIAAKLRHLQETKQLAIDDFVVVCDYRNNEPTELTAGVVSVFIKARLGYTIIINNIKHIPQKEYQMSVEIHRKEDELGLR